MLDSEQVTNKFGISRENWAILRNVGVESSNLFRSTSLRSSRTVYA